MNVRDERTEHTFAPHFEYGISRSVTGLNKSTSPNATPGMYRAHTTCTHLQKQVTDVTEDGRFHSLLPFAVMFKLTVDRLRMNDTHLPASVSL